MLELVEVSHVYANGTRALDHVSLSIPRGMYGLLGPNGAGKSTLMRTGATLQAPSEGRIAFGEIDVIAEPERRRRPLGYLPQDFGVLFAGRTVIHILADSDPGDGFALVDGGLEDVYFFTLAQSRRAA